MNTTTEYKDADEAWEAGNEWIKQSDKWEKLEYLKDLSFRLSIGECWKYRHLLINRSICKRLVKAFRWHKQNCR